MEKQTGSKKKNHGKKFRKFKKFSRKERREYEKKLKEGVDMRGEKKSYEDIVMENAEFETYYRAQNLFKNEKEFSLFMECLKQSLPSAFRISSFCTGQLETMRHSLKGNFIEEMYRNMGAVEINPDKGQKALPDDFSFAPIPWYPNELAWTFNISKIEIRKTPILAKLHKFLVSETHTGDISRQEAVSMIPPLLLDIQPGQSVLDMCAAPGSKTAQLIEMLHRQVNDTFLLDQDGNTQAPPQLDGIVVANDVDNKRCYMLVHQSKRLSSPAAVIINHDAAQMPNFYRTLTDGRKERLKFDRILADVPCTGDGTIRKNYDVWKKWRAFNSISIQKLQLSIAKRGLEILKKDGLMVYSTCSLSPVEDEAVVAELLRMTEGGLELVDVSKLLPKLIFQPGLTTWKVMDKDGILYGSEEELPEKLQGKLRRSLFPPTPEEVSSMNLNNCIRILPHYQNTGGFFVALLKKNVNSFPWENSENEVKVTESKTEPDEKKNKKSKYMGFREEPFNFLTEQSEDWLSIKKYFNLPDNISQAQFAHRASAGNRRNIYFFTKAAANFIVSNEGQTKIINGGTRALCRSDVPTIFFPFRLTQEGLPSFSSYIVHKFKEYEMTEEDKEVQTFKIVEMELESFVKLLKADDMKLDEFDPKLQTRLRGLLLYGSMVLYVRLERPEGKGHFLLPICGWKGKNSVRAYVAKNDRIHLLRLCGAEVDELKETTEITETTTTEKEQGLKRKLSNAEQENEETN